MTAPITSEAIVPVAPYQQVPGSDLSAIGALGRGSVDNIVANCLISGAGYTGMSAAQVGTTPIVAVQPGFMVKGGPAYSLRDAFNVDLSSAIASVPDSAKTAVVLIVADGQEFPSTEARTFVDASRLPTDPTQPAPTVTQATPTRLVRSVVISKVAGMPDVQPQPPAYNAQLCLIATVIVSNTDIVAVVQNAGQQITRLDQLGAYVAALIAFQTSYGPLVDGLNAGLSSLQTALRRLAAQEAADIAALGARIAALESRTSGSAVAILRGVDFFLDASQSDTTRSGYNCKIGHGLTFPDSTHVDIALAPQNNLSPDIQLPSSVNNHLMAHWSVYGDTPSRPSGWTYTGSAGHQPGRPAAMSHSLFDFGGPTSGNIFIRDIGVWRVRWGAALEPLSTAPIYTNGNPSALFSLDSTLVYNPSWGEWLTSTAEFQRENGYWVDVSGRANWRPVIANPTLTSVYNIGIPYSSPCPVQVAWIDVGILPNGPGDITCYVLKCTANGGPDPSRCIASTMVLGSALDKTKATRFVFPYPILVDEPVVFLLTSPSKHRTYCPDQGKMMWISSPALGAGGDGGGFTKTFGAPDFNPGVIRYDAKVVRIPVSPLQLVGGIDGVDLVTKAIVPSGCSIGWEVTIGGQQVPVGKQVDVLHPLSGRPGNLPLWLVLTGNGTVGPIIDLGAATTRASRAGNALQHNSGARVPPASCTQISESVIVDNWNSALHTLTASLESGSGLGTLTASGAPVDATQPDGSLLRTFSWTVGSGGVAAHAVQLVGGTSDSTKTYTVRQANWSAAP